MALLLRAVAFVAMVLAGSVVEAAEAVTISPPSGWTRVERAGAVLYVAPGSEMAFLAVLPAESPAGWPGSFDRGWQSIKAEHRDVEEVPGESGDRNGHAFRISAGSMAEESGRFLYLTYFAARNQRAMQPIVFVATNAKLYEQHAVAVEKALSSVRFTARAAPARVARPKVAALLGAEVVMPAAASSTAPQGGLVGTWSSGSVSPVGFYNPATGEWAAPSGAGQSYELRADGTFVYAGLIQTSMYGCTTRVFVYNTGTWKDAGGKLVLKQKTAKTKSTDNCNKKFNYEKQPALETERYPWKMRDGSLVLTTESGEIEYMRR